MSTLFFVVCIVAAALVATALVLYARRAQRRRRAAAAAAEALVLPVVLVHGLLGFRALGRGPFKVSYFRGLARHLRQAGIPYYAARLSRLGSVPTRAAELADFVRTLPHSRVILVAHSMGGLDARYALSHLGIADRVAGVITIGTPHRGTPLADLAATRPGRAVRALVARLGLRTDALDWLTTERLARFNEEVRDASGVSYTSVVGRCSRWRAFANPILGACSWYLRRRSGSSDGLVPASSQAWGDEVIELDADHLAQIGWSPGVRTPAHYRRLVDQMMAVARAGAADSDGSRGRFAPRAKSAAE